MKDVPGLTQVGMDFRGVLEVRDNVMFMANTAGADGGAVSLPVCVERQIALL